MDETIEDMRRLAGVIEAWLEDNEYDRRRARARHALNLFKEAGVEPACVARAADPSHAATLALGLYDTCVKAHDLKHARLLNRVAAELTEAM